MGSWTAKLRSRRSQARRTATTWALYRKNFERHRATTGVLNTKPKEQREEIDNVEGKASENSNLMMVTSEMVKCLTGLMFLVKAKEAESFEMDDGAIQAADAAARFWGTVMDFVLQVLVIAMALALGFAAGKLSGQQVTAQPAANRTTRTPQ